MSTILNTQQKHSATCYDEDVNSKGKTWLNFNLSIVCQVSLPNGCTAATSQSKGRDIKSCCGQEEFFIKKISHLANTLFQIKVR